MIAWQCKENPDEMPARVQFVTGKRAPGIARQQLEQGYHYQG
jgi:hypothetical protein